MEGVGFAAPSTLSRSIERVVRLGPLSWSCVTTVSDETGGVKFDRTFDLHIASSSRSLT